MRSTILAFFIVICSILNSSEYDQVLEILPYDASGWYGHAKTMQNFIQQKNIKTIIELGTWKGASAIHMAGLLPENGILYAVDHWFCYPYDQSIPIWYQDYKVDQLYHQFLSNVIHAKLTKKIIPIRNGTIEAADYFRVNNIMADLIYVDASHDENSVYMDLVAYFPLLKKGGIFCGDDWNWGEAWGWSKNDLPVNKAVTKFAKEYHLRISVTQSNLWILHP